MTSAELRELALMTSEDFDGRLHTYAIEIKLALGSNLQTCKCISVAADGSVQDTSAVLLVVRRLAPYPAGTRQPVSARCGVGH